KMEMKAIVAILKLTQGLEELVVDCRPDPPPPRPTDPAMLRQFMLRKQPLADKPNPEHTEVAVAFVAGCVRALVQNHAATLTRLELLFEVRDVAEPRTAGQPRGLG